MKLNSGMLTYLVPEVPKITRTRMSTLAPVASTGAPGAVGYFCAPTFWLTWHSGWKGRQREEYRQLGY